MKDTMTRCLSHAGEKPDKCLSCKVQCLERVLVEALVQCRDFMEARGCFGDDGCAAFGGEKCLCEEAVVFHILNTPLIQRVMGQKGGS